MNIYKIALTGGPCAGKTSVLKGIKELLEQDGYHVITVPETATYLIANGTPPLPNEEHGRKFQDLVLKAQITKEKIAIDYCTNTLETQKDFFKGKKGIVIICDRGIMDNRAYLSQVDYDNMLYRHNLNELELLYSYDLAINLVSLATTNKEMYALDGIRYETVEMAALRDEITSSSWLLHPNLHMIKPTDNIDDKINLVHNIILMNLNNIKIEDKITITDKPNNITLNQNNSKTCTKTTYYIKNTTNILTKINYAKHELYLFNNEIITKEEYLSLLNLDLLELIQEETIINYIQDGNRYQTIKTNNKVFGETKHKSLKRTRRIH